ncbi:MAG: MmgE/PrpD family protein [Burkholderiales bacterium]|nr:MmgE/PrpD family protein [Burkholderiales bacterium]
MDSILDFLSDCVVSLSYEKLDPKVVHHVRRRLVDTFGCAVGAYPMLPPQIARSRALEVSAAPGATLLGTRHRTSPELAAFANGVMARYLDFNDTSMTGNGGHPSDSIMCVLAAAEYAGANLKAAIEGIAVAYEVQSRFATACNDLRANGWDNAVYMVLAATSGACKAMSLDKNQTANALALAAVANGAMGQTRVGELSMWKGCTAPNAARNAVFSAILAGRGMTGPREAFEGPRGYKKQLGTSLQLNTASFGGNGTPFAVETDKYKLYPCDYEAQCAATPALELHAVVKDRLDEIEQVDIETYAFAVDVAADTPEKWEPVSRETADHSLPYVMAVALTRGRLWLDDFDEARVRDPGIRALMRKIHVRCTDECNSLWPEAYPFRIAVTLKSGERHVRKIDYAKGHPKNPMSDDELSVKFRALAEPIIGVAGADHALSGLWAIDVRATIGELMDLVAIDSSN